MEWLRLYTDVLDDRRFFQMPAELYRRWTMLLMVAKRHGGQIPPNADIAFALRISEDEARGTLDDLAAYGLIDHGDDGELTPHNWSNRQYASDSSTERVRKHRQSHRAMSHETFQERSTEHTPGVPVTVQNRTDSESEQSQKQIPPLSPPPEPTEAVAPSATARGEKPHDLWEVYCEEVGAESYQLAPAFKSKQLGVARRLLDQGYGEDKVRPFLRFLKSQDWRSEPVDLLTVEKGIGKWEANGMPAAAAPARASPNGKSTERFNELRDFAAQGLEPISDRNGLARGHDETVHDVVYTVRDKGRDERPQQPVR
jgi:hypothetical protein